ncbi:hypothetical protein M5689_019925 [Euphorbia peplus]|nr:hypothetical protein M5689_019925 [Euphorbia peplus]
MTRYDVNTILESSTLPIGGAAKRLKDIDHHQADITTSTAATHNTSSNTVENTISSHMISDTGMATYPWPTLAFQQANHHHQNQAFTMHYPYGQKLWCKQEQDTDLNNYANSTHNFLQPSVLHNLMSLDSGSMEHSSGSNSGIYSGEHGNYYGVGGGGYAIPVASMVVSDNQNQYGDHGGESQVKVYENMLSSSISDSYDGRNLYNWVPTAVPTIAHGPSTFTVWSDT